MLKIVPFLSLFSLFFLVSCSPHDSGPLDPTNDATQTEQIPDQTTDNWIEEIIIDDAETENTDNQNNQINQTQVQEEVIQNPKEPDCQKITYALYFSPRSLDGSDSVEAGGKKNIWAVSLDGQSTYAITQLKNANAENGSLKLESTKMLYVSDRVFDGTDNALENATVNIWVADLETNETSPLTLLTAKEAHSLGPKFSPDGEKILYQSQRALDGNDAKQIWNIWVMDSDGANAKPLTFSTKFAFSMQPFWSNDGKEILYNGIRNPANPDQTYSWEIWKMNADGSGDGLLTDSGFQNWTVQSRHPRQTQNGQIVYFSNRGWDDETIPNAGDKLNIWIMNSNGENPKPLTMSTKADSKQVFQPQGKDFLLFSSSLHPDDLDEVNLSKDGKANFNIWRMDLDGSNKQPLTDLHEADSRLGFLTPDGLHIIYNSNRALDGSDQSIGVVNLWITDLDGISHEPLTRLENVGIEHQSPESFFEKVECK